MRKISSFIAAVGLAVGLSQTATAADLPRKAPAYVPPAPPPLTWTGCYIGANIGGAWGRFELDTAAGDFHRTNSGFAGGGQIGCDYQFAGSGLVIGFRNIFDGTTNHRDGTFTVTDPTGALVATGTADFHNRWFDALTGRIGARPRLALLLRDVRSLRRGGRPKQPANPGLLLFESTRRDR